jgi:hypothetical protein
MNDGEVRVPRVLYVEDFALRRKKRRYGTMPLALLVHHDNVLDAHLLVIGHHHQLKLEAQGHSRFLTSKLLSPPYPATVTDRKSCAPTLSCPPSTSRAGPIVPL